MTAEDIFSYNEKKCLECVFEHFEMLTSPDGSPFPSISQLSPTSLYIGVLHTTNTNLDC